MSEEEKQLETATKKSILYMFDDFDEKDELVRRSDVEELIRERLNKQVDRVKNLTKLDNLDLNDAKARRHELRNLLDEVQKE